MEVQSVVLARTVVVYGEVIVGVGVGVQLGFQVVQRTKPLPGLCISYIRKPEDR